MEITWEEPGPQTRGRNSLYQDFAAELRIYPKRWAKYPRAFSSPNNASQAASNQRRGTMVSLPPTEFEVVARDVFLFVRYIGD